MGSIYFKLSSWSQNNFESVPIDSNAPQISIGELKQLISKKKKLASNVGLVITNAQTNEEYKQETDTIQRNSSVIVKVVPNYSQPSASSSGGGSSSSSNLPAAQASGYKKTLPPGYVCHRCGQMNQHHASECPTLGDTSLKKKPQTMHGVPKSFLNQDLTKGPSFKPNEFEFVKAISAAGLNNREQNTAEIPVELKCPLCNKLLKNAVSIPCCMASACDECIRSALLEEENDFHCPLCRNPVIPDNLIPNKTLRTSVEDYLDGQFGSEQKNSEPEKKPPKENRNNNKPRKSKSPDRKKSRERSPKRSKERSPDRNRERSPHRDRSRGDKERERDRGDKERERDKGDKERERERGDKERERDRGDGKDSRERRRSNDRGDDRDRERDRERERRERDRGDKERERERGDRERERGDRDSHHSNSSHREREDRDKRKSRENSPDRKERGHSDKRSRH